MNCTQSRKLIDDLASGTASAMQQQALESHLEACQVCRQHLDVTEKMILRVHELPVLDPQPGFEERIMDSLDNYSFDNKSTSKHTHWFAAGFGGALAAGLLLGLLVGLWLLFWTTLSGNFQNHILLFPLPVLVLVSMILILRQQDLR